MNHMLRKIYLIALVVMSLLQLNIIQDNITNRNAGTDDWTLAFH